MLKPPSFISPSFLRRRGGPAAALLAAVLVLGSAPPAWANADGARPDRPRDLSKNTFVGNYLAGRQAQRDGNLAAAADYYGAALKQQPDTPGLLRQTFFVALIEGRMDEAVALAKAYTRKDPKQNVAHLTLAVDHLKHERFKAAEAELAKLPSGGLSTFTKPLLRAWTRVGLKRTKKALDSLKPLKLHKGMEDLTDVHEALILDVTGKPKDAIKRLAAVIERQSPPATRVTYLLGRLYEQAGDRERARAVYKLYLDDHPGSRLMDVPLARLAAGKASKKLPSPVVNAVAGAAESLFDISSSLREQRARETAIALGRLALHLKPDFPVMRFYMADMLESENRPEQAVAMYDSVPTGSPYGWNARTQAAGLLGEMKRIDEARVRLKKLADLRPDLSDPYVHLGDILRREKHFDEAAHAYGEAIKRVKKVDERHWGLFYARGIVYERAGEWEKSEADLLKALELKPNQPYVLNYLGYSWIDQGLHLKKATAMIRKAVDLAPNDGYIADSLGWAYYRQGTYDKAVEELERAVELRPQDPVINDHLGDAYWRVGRRLEAEFQWKRALGFEPDAELAPKLREKIKSGLPKAQPINAKNGTGRDG